MNRRPQPRLFTPLGCAAIVCIIVLPLLAGFLIWGQQ